MCLRKKHRLFFHKNALKLFLIQWVITKAECISNSQKKNQVDDFWVTYEIAALEILFWKHLEYVLLI